MSQFLVTIRGLPHIPTIKEVNVRGGPGTNNELVFKVPVGMSGLDVRDIQPDGGDNNLNGKIYQWFQLVFHGGAVGWVRDDLLDIQGDGTAWGYPNLDTKTFAFMLARGTVPAPSTAQSQPAAPSVVDEAQPPTPATTSGVVPTDNEAAVQQYGNAHQQIDRIKRAAFAITAAFEGTGYKAYNNYDAGIVSYGLIQFTLAAGSLVTVIQYYLDRSQSDVANQLRGMFSRIQARDPNLRNDQQFKNLLLAAADEPQMREAQDYVATINYWDKVVNGYIIHRNLRLPLTWALLFDMGVNFGTGHGFVRAVENELGVQPRSVPGQNGITEIQLMTEVAKLRKLSHDRQAERDNLPGLKLRGDFWMNLVNQGDWGFNGDANGNMQVLGKLISVG